MKDSSSPFSKGQKTFKIDRNLRFTQFQFKETKTIFEKIFGFFSLPAIPTPTPIGVNISGSRWKFKNRYGDAT